MKNAKRTDFFTFGFLALLLAGCFNPVPAVPPQNDPGVNSFTVDVQIGKETEDGKSIAGPDSARIKGANIRNFIQLIVVNEEGTIVALEEARKENDSDTQAILKIETLTFGQTYHFLLLMGHWDRDSAAEQSSGGNYVYKTGVLPTLLAAGLKTRNVEGSGKVTITMWPIAADTKFSVGEQTAEPPVTDGKPGAASLFPADWDVKWTITQGQSVSPKNGLQDLLRAQTAIGGEGGSLLLKSTPQILVKEEGKDGTWIDVVPPAAALSGNTVTGSIKNYTSFQRIGKEAAANFRLEYIPFHLIGETANPWALYNGKSVLDLSRGGPVWIIRNGVNDDAQDENTDFKNFLISGAGGAEANANGNGAVRFTAAVKTPGEGPGGGSRLAVGDGTFTGWSTDTADVSFITGGYDGNAEVYYAIVPAGGSAPDYSDYTLLDDDTVPPGPNTESIPVSRQEGVNYDIYVIVYKDGEVSAPCIIRTQSGSIEVEGIWGIETYQDYYVSAEGFDSDPGTREKPLKTVTKALEKLANDYTGTWTGKGTDAALFGGIVIMDTNDGDN
jgi:hypothetical protein